MTLFNGISVADLPSVKGPRLNSHWKPAFLWTGSGLWKSPQIIWVTGDFSSHPLSISTCLQLLGLNGLLNKNILHCKFSSRSESQIANNNIYERGSHFL